MASSVTGSTEGGLRYRVDGPSNGRVVLFVNALGTAMDLWEAQVGALADRFRVVRYDARGHGASAIPPGDYTIDDLGRDALSVLDAVAAPRAFVGGISLGGLTTMWLGANAPDRVDGLLVANTAARVGPEQRWIDRIALVRASGMRAVADLAMTAWFTEGFRTREPATVERFRAMVAASPPDGYLGCCAALRDADLRDDIDRIRARTLVIAGRQDPSTPLADAEFVAGRIPGARLAVLESAHLSNVECADEFTRQVEGLLG
jgi:3-oxoadipate enol-lactonase